MRVAEIDGLNQMTYWLLSRALNSRRGIDMDEVIVRVWQRFAAA